MRLVVFRLLRGLAPGRCLILLIVNGVHRVGTLHFAFKLLILGGDILLQNFVSAELAVLLNPQHFLLMDASEYRVGKGIDFEHTKAAGARGVS